MFKKLLEYINPSEVSGAILDARVVVPGAYQKAYASVDILMGIENRKVEILSVIIPLSEVEIMAIEFFGVEHKGYEADSFFPSERFLVDEGDELLVRRSRWAPRFYHTNEWANGCQLLSSTKAILRYTMGEGRRVDLDAFPLQCRDALYRTEYGVWEEIPSRWIRGHLRWGNHCRAVEGVKHYARLMDGGKFYLLPRPRKDIRKAITCQYKYVGR